MGSVNLEILDNSSLEEKLKDSIFNRHYRVMDRYIYENLKKKGSNFFIPTIQTLVERSPELEEELINLYNRKFPMSYTGDIDYEIKLLQASVFDGLVVGLNIEKDGEFQIYTANTKAIFGIDINSRFNIEKTLEMNRNRIVHAVRIDIEYTSEKGFKYKVVGLNKNTNLHIFDIETFRGRFHLVPYIAIQRSMRFFKDMLDDMRVLDVKQDKGELCKRRYITTRVNELVKYSDNEEFAKSLKPSYFPLKGFFYAPSLGASSLSTGVTRIDLLDVSNVRNVTKVNMPSKVSGFDDMIKESSMFSILTEMYDNDIKRYQEIVDKLPNTNVLTGAVFDVDKGVLRPLSIIKYMYSLSSSEKAEVESYIPGLNEEVFRKKSVLNKYEKLNPFDYSLDEIRRMLKTGVYKFIIRKKNCNYSSITATNSEKLLASMYGRDYFSKYESFGVRLYKLEYLLRRVSDLNRESIVPIFNYCGFPSDDNTIGSVLEELRLNGFNFRNEEHDSIGNRGSKFHGVLANILEDKDRVGRGKAIRSSSSNEGVILVRKCFASMTSSGSVDFYRYLDMSKVISMFRVG